MIEYSSAAEQEKLTLRKLLVLFVLFVALGLTPVQQIPVMSSAQTPIVYYLPERKMYRKVRRTALRRLGRIR